MLPELPEQRALLIQQYRRGPSELEAALSETTEASRSWRPGRGEWTIHEIICHCADSETSGYVRIRMLAAESSPLIVGYDQDLWATLFDYASLPLETSLSVVRAVRASTSDLLDRLPETVWIKEGRHSESGVYDADTWLSIYGVHLTEHAEQIRRNHKQWVEQRQPDIADPK